ncbi:MAG: hypothetical protein JWN48_4895, partial [Myxococcaceae bacterium]|nr:hypothetical protein [Myxococcaceae bacterium]
MTQLSPEAAALLEAARRSHGPSESDRERVLSSLHASLGIALPLALASSVAEAATEAAAQLPAASVVESGAQLASTAEGAAHVVGQGALKLGGKGALQLGTKLLTWKMGKVLLATVALGGAVGVGISQAPRKVEQDSVEVRTTRALVRPAARDAHSESVNPASSTGATTEPVPAEPEPREPERNRVTAVAELQQPRAQ